MFSRNRLSLLASAFSPLTGFRFGIHFDTPDDDSGGTGGGTGGGTATLPAAAATTPATPATPASNDNDDTDVDSEAAKKRAIRERRKARQAFNALLRGMGIDPSTIRTVHTGDPENPVRIESITGGDIAAVLNAARAGIAATAGGQRLPKNGTAAAVELETLRGQVATLKQQNKALTSYIRKMSVVLPIRAACAKNGAIDDDNGNYSDIVRELEPAFQVEIDIDPDNANAEPEVTVTPMSGNKPMMNAAANAVHTPESLVVDLLTRKPKHRAANFRSGPGAGAHRVGPAAANGNGNGTRQFATVTTPAATEPETVEEKTVNSVAEFMGLSPQLVKNRMR